MNTPSSPTPSILKPEGIVSPDGRPARSKAYAEDVASVMVAVASTESWEARFGADLVSMAITAMGKPHKDYRAVGLAFSNERGSMLWEQRDKLVKRAMEHELTHILWIDADQRFPPDLLHRLLAHRKDVVACNVAIKKIPSAPTARKLNEEGKIELVFTDANSTGLEKVWGIGLGVALIRLEVFKRIPEPWFQVSSGGPSDRMGEDWYMFAKIRDAGIPLYIDHDLSKEIYHVGRFDFGHEHMGPKHAYTGFPMENPYKSDEVA